MTPADLARQNAIAIELKKDGLAQRQSGDWQVRFTVQAADMDQRLVAASMGQRFMAALVMIGDDELPAQCAPTKEVDHEHARVNTGSAPPSASQAEAPAKERQRWIALTPTVQAVLRCEQPAFHAFLREERKQVCEGQDDAAQIVRKICGVNTRAALTTNTIAAVAWSNLDSEFQAWSRT